MINTLLIDLDGTLVDSKQASKLLYDNIAKYCLNDIKLGKNLRVLFKKYCDDGFLTIPHSEYLKNIEPGWDAIFLTDFSSKTPKIIEIYEKVSEYKYSKIKSILSELGIKEEVIIKSIISFIDENWIKYYTPFNETYKFLEECCKFKKYILTNGLTNIQLKKIKYCKLYKAFDDIFISEMFGIGKPYVEYFERILHKTNIDKRDTIMIGNGKSDIIGAENIGIKSIYLKENNDFEEIELKATAVVRSLNEIPKLLELI